MDASESADARGVRGHGSLRFRDLERFLNDRSTVAGTLEVPSEWLPESAVPHPLLWARVPRADVRVYVDPGRNVNWHGHLVRDEEILFPVHWWDREVWTGYRIEELGLGWIGSSFRTVMIEPGTGSPLPDDLAERLVLKLNLDAGIPGVRGNRTLDPPRVEKCVRISEDLRDLAMQGEISRRLGFFEKPLGLAVGGRGVLFREIPHPGLVPGFSFWAERRGAVPIVVEYIDRASVAGGVERRFLENIAQPLLESVMSAMRCGYGLEMHAQNTCFLVPSDGAPLKVYYRDLEGVAYSGRLRAGRFGADPLAAGNSEIHKYEATIFRMFNRNFDQDLTTVLTRSLDALERHERISPGARKATCREVRRMYRDLRADLGLQRWDPFPRVSFVSRSPYGSGYRRSHWYRRMYR